MCGTQCVYLMCYINVPLHNLIFKREIDTWHTAGTWLSAFNNTAWSCFRHKQQLVLAYLMALIANNLQTKTVFFITFYSSNKLDYVTPAWIYIFHSRCSFCNDWCPFSFCKYYERDGWSFKGNVYVSITSVGLIELFKFFVRF